jgi:hypothetical protein
MTYLLSTQATDKAFVRDAYRRSGTVTFQVDGGTAGVSESPEATALSLRERRPIAQTFQSAMGLIQV